MIGTLFYSIAGKKAQEEIDTMLVSFLAIPTIPKKEKDIIHHTLTVVKKGKYPSKDYYSQYYSFLDRLNSIAEILALGDSIIDFYNREFVISSVYDSINENEKTTDLISSLSKIVETTDSVSDLEAYEVKTFKDTRSKPEETGYLLGVKEVDTVTNGFQGGTMGAICAFTSEGKTTTCISSIYKNLNMGRCGIYMSLELHPNMVWLMVQARWLFDKKNLDVSVSDMIKGTVSKSMREEINSHDEEFKEFIAGKLLVLDETLLSLPILTSTALLKNLMKSAEKRLDSLDFIWWDHVNQFEVMFPKSGNSIIKCLQSTFKTYKNKKSEQPFCGICVQCNREGWKRARKKKGIYDYLAISDLNEIERSSTYILFEYTSDELKINQETGFTMPKHRIGAPITDLIVTNFNPVVLLVGDVIEEVTFDSNDLSVLGSIGSMEGLEDMEDDF